MERSEVYEKLNEVFRTIFDDENIVVCDKTVAEDIEGWDSLEQINLVVAVEKKFGIKFSMTEMLWDNVGEMCDTILKKITK